MEFHSERFCSDIIPIYVNDINKESNSEKIVRFEDVIVLLFSSAD